VTAYGLALGVFCAEDAATTDRNAMIAEGRKVLPELPDSLLALAPQAPFMFSDCDQWDVPAAPAAVHAPAASDRPVLILGGALDAITAPPNGDLVAQSLPAATRVLFPDSAHDVLLWSTACALPVMRSFLDQPASPDTGCTAGLAVTPFETT
jgi:pimeloyl-ACP methyl ester carboxylesterase